MPKYLVKVLYNPEGARGLMKNGGTARRTVADELIQKAGGKMEAFYFAFGDDDAYVLADLPNSAAVVAVNLAVNASGAVRLSTVPLITPEEVDAASKMAVGGTARPGHSRGSPRAESRPTEKKRPTLSGWPFLSSVRPPSRRPEGLRLRARQRTPRAKTFRSPPSMT